MSLEKYSNMLKVIDEEKALEARFGVVDIDKALEEAEEEATNPNTKFYTHDEMKKIIGRGIDEK